MVTVTSPKLLVAPVAEGTASVKVVPVMGKVYRPYIHGEKKVDLTT